jgi:hypothetical protein
MPKLKTSEKIFLVRIFDMFSVEAPIAIDILRLMFGCNDIYLVEQWANDTKATPTNKGAQIITTGRNTLQLRLLCSFLIVSLEVLDALTKRSGFEALRLLLTDEGQLALSKLSEIRLAKFEFSTSDWEVNETILKARHTATAHYDFNKARDVMLKWRGKHSPTEAGPIVFRHGLDGSDPYYGIADMAIAEMSFELGGRNFRQNVDGIFALLHSLRVVVDAIFWAYVKDRNLESFIRSDEKDV